MKPHFIEGMQGRDIPTCTSSHLATHDMSWQKFRFASILLSIGAENCFPIDGNPTVWRAMKAEIDCGSRRFGRMISCTTY
jgi:hypothetical protein